VRARVYGGLYEEAPLARDASEGLPDCCKLGLGIALDFLCSGE
jgi:hypothetical protein